MILVGITHEGADGTESREQFAGIARIEARERYDLVVLDCIDGVVRGYPFDGQSLERAAPGEYRLKSTGEIISDPDFLMTWTVTKGE